MQLTCSLEICSVKSDTSSGPLCEEKLLEVEALWEGDSNSISLPCHELGYTQ